MDDTGAHCRVSRVRMKAGADLTILRRHDINDLGDTLLQHSRGIAQMFGMELAGFIVIGWDTDGAYSSGSRLSFDGPITPSLLPSWLAEIARREVVTSQQVRDVISSEYEVTPPRPPA